LRQRPVLLALIIAAAASLAAVLLLSGNDSEVAVGHRMVVDGSVPLVDNGDRFYFVGNSWLASDRQLWERVEEELLFQLPLFLLEQGWAAPESWGIWGTGAQVSRRL
jgi:hypothetical protein